MLLWILRGSFLAIMIGMATAAAGTRQRLPHLAILNAGARFGSGNR